MAIDTEERGVKKDDNPNAPKAATNNKKVVKIVLIVVGIIVVLGIIGTILAGFLAKKVFETGIEAATGGSVKVDVGGGDDGKVTVEGKDGTKVESSNGKELPKDLPSEVPLYDGAKLTHSTTTTIGDKGTSYSLMFSTSDSAEDVYAFYKSALSKDGWKTSVSQQSDSYNMIVSKNKSADLGVNYSDMLDDKDKSGLDFMMTVTTDVNKK